LQRYDGEVTVRSTSLPPIFWTLCT
jgi:hypothetical protein